MSIKWLNILSPSENKVGLAACTKRGECNDIVPGLGLNQSSEASEDEQDDDVQQELELEGSPDSSSSSDVLLFSEELGASNNDEGLEERLAQSPVLQPPPAPVPAPAAVAEPELEHGDAALRH